MRLYPLVFTLLQAVANGEDRQCELVAGGVPYTGLRVQREWAIDSAQWHERRTYRGNTNSNIVVTECTLGSAAAEFMLSGSTPIFNNSLCDPKKEGGRCFRLARRREYVTHNRTLFLAGSLVGGAFSSDDPELLSWKPYSPVISESVREQFIIVSGSRVALRRGLVRSPDILEKYFTATDSWTTLLTAEEPAAGPPY